MPPPTINAPPITPSQSLCCFARVNHAHIERHGKAVELPGGDDPPSAEYESAVLPLNYGSLLLVCSEPPPELPFCATPIGVVSQPPRVSPILTRLVCPGLHILYRHWAGSLALAPRRAWPYHRPSCVEAQQAAHESSFSRFLHRLRGLCRGWDLNPRPRAFNSNIPSRCKALPTELPRHNAGLSRQSAMSYNITVTFGMS